MNGGNVRSTYIWHVDKWMILHVCHTECVRTHRKFYVTDVVDMHDVAERHVSFILFGVENVRRCVQEISYLIK